MSEVLGRYQRHEPLAAAEGQVRFAARDAATGESLELVGPARLVAMRPGARAHFEAAQQRPGPAPAALLPAGLCGEDEGRPIATRPVTHGPLPADLHLDPDTAWALAAWLAPAVIAAQGALGGELTPADLVLDDRDTVRLAPAGLVPAPMALQPPRFRAPEVLAGAPVGPGSALYGLGVVLFRAVTGSWPVDARTRAELRHAGPPRHARSIDPNVPERLDRLLAGLLSPGPADRLRSCEALPAPQPVVPDLAPVPSPQQRAPTAPAVHTTRTAPAPKRSRVDRVLPDWAVVVDGAGLTQAAQERAAALADRPEAVVHALLDAGLPVPVGEADTHAQAVAQASHLSDQGLSAHPAPTAGRSATLVGSAAGALLCVLLATGITLVSSPLGPLTLRADRRAAAVVPSPGGA